MLQGYCRVAKEEGGDTGVMEAQYDQGSRSCDVGNKVIEHLGVLPQTDIYSDERRCRQTCVAATRSRSEARYSRTLDMISSGSPLTGANLFLIPLIACKTSERSFDAVDL